MDFEARLHCELLEAEWDPTGQWICSCDSVKEDSEMGDCAYSTVSPQGPLRREEEASHRRCDAVLEELSWMLGWQL